MDKQNDQIAHRRIVAGREILRKYRQNNNSPATPLLRTTGRLLGKLPAVNSQEVGKSEKSRLVPMLPVSAALIGTFKAPRLQICPVLPFVRRRPGSVQNCIDSRLRVIAFCQHEEERTHARTSMLRPLSYVWCRRRGGL
jgi:hypothetical protein